MVIKLSRVLIMAVITQPFVSKLNTTIHFKSLDFIVGKFHLNKNVLNG